MRSDRPEQARLVGENGDIADGLRATGDRDREIDQHPPGVVMRPPTANSLQRIPQLAGQRRRIREVGQQP